MPTIGHFRNKKQGYKSIKEVMSDSCEIITINLMKYFLNSLFVIIDVYELNTNEIKVLILIFDIMCPLNLSIY